MPRPIKVIVITDPFGLMPEAEEAAEIVQELQEQLGKAVDLVGHSSSLFNLRDRAADLVVIDYGGMSVGGAHDTANAQVDYACRWAENHPGKLLVIWTDYTRDLYEAELADQFGHLDNIKYQYMARLTYDANPAIAAWFASDEFEDWQPTPPTRLVPPDRTQGATVKAPDAQ